MEEDTLFLIPLFFG